MLRRGYHHPYPLPASLRQNKPLRHPSANPCVAAMTESSPPLAIFFLKVEICCENLSNNKTNKNLFFFTCSKTVIKFKLWGNNPWIQPTVALMKLSHISLACWEKTFPTSAFISAPVENYECSRETEEAKACHGPMVGPMEPVEVPLKMFKNLGGESISSLSFTVLRLLLVVQCQTLRGCSSEGPIKNKGVSFPLPKSSVGHIWPWCTFRLEYDSYHVHHGVGLGKSLT